MGKKEALKNFHQTTIANAADRLFQENGIDRTTMDDIAKAADYSKATIYVYFKSKDEIYNFIILKAFDMLRDVIETALKAENDTLKQYSALCSGVAEFSEKHPFYYNCLMKTIAIDEESRKASPILEDIYQAGEDINYKIGMFLESGVKQGYFRPEANTLQTVLLLWSSISNAVQFAVNKADYLEQRVGQTKNQFLDFSFNTLLRTITL